MPTLTLIRGLPGSGKSTLAQKLWQERWLEDMNSLRLPQRYEADQFFIDKSGDYCFNSTLLREAHTWCYLNTLKCLREGVDAIVSNTFTQNWEMEKYLRLQDKIENLTIKIYEVKTQFTSIHGVGDEKIEQMRSRWEDLAIQGVDLSKITVEVIK